MALTRVSGRVVYPHGEDTPTPVTGDGVIEYVHATPGVIGEAVHGPDRHRIEYTDGVAGEAWLKAGMWRAYVYPSEGRSYTLHLGVPEGGDVTLADVVGEVVPEGIVTKGDPGEPGEPGRDGQDGHTPEITFDGTTIIVDGTPGPDLKGDPGEGGGGIAGAVPIFATLAEAQAWEAENPGKVALTLEPSATDTTPPSWSAILTVKSVGSTQIVITASAAATDDRGVMYEVSQDGMSWAPIAPVGLDFTVTGLAMSTSYTLRFRAVDDGGNTSQVLTAPAVTTTAAAPDDYAYQWVAEDFTSGSWPARKGGVALTGTIPASLVGDEVLFGKTANGSPGYSTSGLAGGEHRTLMVVARLTSTPGTNLHGFIGQPGPHAIAIPGGGGAKAGWYSTDGTTTKASNVGGNGSVDGGKHVVTVRIDGASSTLTHDRTTVAAQSGPGAVLDTLQVGAGLHGYNHQHAVSEIRIYPRRLTDGELTALHSEMGATYGIPL